MRSSMLRYPLFAAVIIMMFAGGWAALQRSGWSLPTLRPSLVGMHGPLMIGGVFGMLIALERAVAIAALRRSPRHWSFLAPLLAGIGGALLLLDGATVPARVLLTAASAMLVAVYAVTATRHHYWSLHTAIMCLGAVLWTVGNALWLAGQPVYVLVYAWMGFIILTIVGERLELSRVMRPTKQTERLLLGAVAIYTVGALLVIVDQTWGTRIAGSGAILLALWLLRFDVAGRRLRASGLTRYISICLFAGYIWLAVAGVLAIAFGAVYAGLRYDAVIHAVVGGFIFSMVFGHAPMIFPALAGREIHFSHSFYLALALLHAAIALRVGSDLVGSFDGRMWASLLNAGAVLLFLGMIARGALAQQQPAGVHNP